MSGGNKSLQTEFNTNEYRTQSSMKYFLYFSSLHLFISLLQSSTFHSLLPPVAAPQYLPPSPSVPSNLSFFFLFTVPFSRVCGGIYHHRACRFESGASQQIDGPSHRCAAARKQTRQLLSGGARDTLLFILLFF